MNKRILFFCQSSSMASLTILKNSSRLVFDPRSESTNTMRGERPIDSQIYDIILNFLIVE